MADNKLLGASGLYFGVNEISKAFMGNNLVWEKAGEAGPDYSKEYFCIEALDYCDITFTPRATIENGHVFWYKIFYGMAYDRPPMDFLYDMFYTGGDYDVFDPYSDHSLSINLGPGDIVYIIGNMNMGVSRYGTDVETTFEINYGKVNLSGNIMSLTHGMDRHTLEPTRPIDLPDQTFERKPNLNVGELGRLFKNQPVVDAGNLVLPSDILNNFTYWEMFCGCTDLTTPPKKLPALSVFLQTYGSMFDGCTSLTTAPVLSAKNLGNNSYRNMFRNCTSLTTAPVLPATTLTSRCYYQMFDGCTSLNYIKAMFTTTPGSYTQNWVRNVSATGTFVKNSWATWDVTGNNGIPSGWTVQTASS